VKHLLDQIGRNAVKLWHTVWSPTPVTVRRWALAAVVVNAGITVSGAAVRVTKSGLGCPTWPRCTPGSFIPAAHGETAPINMAIEFGNRMLSFLVLLAAVLCVLGAWRMRPARRTPRVLAAIQVGGIVAQALWGGMLVLVKLPPGMVAVHYLLSAGLIAAAVALYVRVAEGDGPPRPLVSPWLRRAGTALVAAVGAVLIGGTVVTGTGPHAGDDQAPRLALDIELVAQVHSATVWITVALTLVILMGLRASAAPSHVTRAAGVLLAVEGAQGGVGYAQYALGVPAALVGVHLLGSVLTWVATLWLVYAMRERPADPATGTPAGSGSREAADPEATTPVTG
jgi:heme a synthase